MSSVFGSRLIVDFRDAWAEDGSTEASVRIDLSDCVSVHPLSAARNYGIEIKVGVR